MTAKFLNLALYEKENYRDFPSTKPVLSEAEMLGAGISRIAAINQCIMLKFIWVAKRSRGKELVHRAPDAELPFFFYIPIGIGYR